MDRYSWDYGGMMKWGSSFPDNGEYILYEDYLKEIEQLKKENKLLKSHLRWLIKTVGCPTTMEINEALKEE